MAVDGEQRIGCQHFDNHSISLLRLEAVVGHLFGLYQGGRMY